jgi:hypothetical protein
MPNLDALFQPQECGPILHLYPPKISQWVDALSQHWKLEETPMQPEDAAAEEDALT